MTKTDRINKSLNDQVVLFYHSHRIGPKTRSALDFLSKNNIKFTAIDVGLDPLLESEVVEKTGWNLFPQLFVDGEFIGGWFIIDEFVQSGELGRIVGNRQLVRTCSSRMQAAWRIRKFDPQNFAVALASGMMQIHSSVQPTLSLVQAHVGWNNSVCYSPDGEKIASCSTDASIKVWNRSGELLRELVGHSRWVNDIVFVSNSKLVSVSADLTLKLWEVESGEVLASRTGHKACIWGVCLVSSDVVVTCDADGSISTWHLPELTPLKSFRGHKRCVTSLVSSGLDEFVSTSFDGEVIRWSLAGRPLTMFLGHSQRVWGAAVSVDGKLLATASADCSIRVWTISNGACVRQIVLKSPATCCEFVDFDTRLIIGTLDGVEVRYGPFD